MKNLTCNKLNTIVLLIGLCMVYYCTESIAAVWWAFFASIHFGVDKRAGTTTLGELWLQLKSLWKEERAKAEEARRNER